MSDNHLTHVDSESAARMVHVGEEPVTARRAVALAIIDMGKAVDKAMTIEGIRVAGKSGGRSSDCRAGKAGLR